MEQEKINQDLEKTIQKTIQQINNLEVINDKSDITIDIPDKVMLDQLYNDLKTFGKNERNIFLSKLSKIENMNAKNKSYIWLKKKKKMHPLLQQRYHQNLNQNLI